MSPHDSTTTPAHSYAAVRWIDNLDDLKEALFAQPGPAAAAPERRKAISNGFLVLLNGRVLGVGPRPTAPEAQAQAAKETPHVIRWLDWLRYHIALWDWYDSKPGIGHSPGELADWLDQMPEPPR